MYVIGMCAEIVMYILFMIVHSKYFFFSGSVLQEIRDALICSMLSWVGVVVIFIMFILCFIIKDKKSS